MKKEIILIQNSFLVKVLNMKYEFMSDFPLIISKNTQF